MDRRQGKQRAILQVVDRQRLRADASVTRRHTCGAHGPSPAAAGRGTPRGIRAVERGQATCSGDRRNASPTGGSHEARAHWIAWRPRARFAGARAGATAAVAAGRRLPVERPFVEGGRVRLQLASGDYTIRAGASDRIVVRWEAGDDARDRADLKKLVVDVHAAGLDGHHRDRRTGQAHGVHHRAARAVRRAPADARRRHAGAVGIEGHKDIRMTAGRPEDRRPARVAGSRARVGHLRRPRRPCARHLEERHQALARLDWRRHLRPRRPPRRRRPHPRRDALSGSCNETAARATRQV